MNWLRRRVAAERPARVPVTGRPWLLSVDTDRELRSDDEDFPPEYWAEVDKAHEAATYQFPPPWTSQPTEERAS